MCVCVCVYHLKFTNRNVIKFAWWQIHLQSYLNNRRSACAVIESASCQCEMHCGVHIGVISVIWRLALSPCHLAFSSVCDISLGRRAELLEQMESRREQLKIQRKQQQEKFKAARHRNSTLLQVQRAHIPSSSRAMMLMIISPTCLSSTHRTASLHSRLDWLISTLLGGRQCFTDTSLTILLSFKQLVLKWFVD